MIKYLKQNTLKNKTVLLRADLNCPVENGRLNDDFRIVQSLPTIKLLLSGGNKLILCGHLGRPRGKWDKAFSFLPVAKHLAQLLKLKFLRTDGDLLYPDEPHLVFFTGSLLESQQRKRIRQIPVQHLVFLENIRFYKQEEENDAGFARSLAALADVYINDAFSVDHHAAVSVSGVPKYLPAYAGLLLEKEISALSSILKKASQPFVVMTGGVKLSEKVGALDNLGKKADKILLGGGVANLFFRSSGLEIGISKIEEGETKTAWQLQKNFKDKILLPVDVVVANKAMDKDSIRVAASHDVRKGEQILDAGPKTILLFAGQIKKAKTILWSGPLGYFEKPPFHNATFALARLIGGRGKGRAFVVAGGGETEEVLEKTHQLSHIDHVSTGGGAMLDFLAGKELPGIEALK